MTPLRQRMLEELQLRNLSETTIHTYLRLVERFAKHFGASPIKLGPDHVRQYLLHLLNDKKDTWATVQVNRGALKFLYVRVLKQSWFDEEIAAPKRRPRLPTVMSAEEIARILDRTTNLKHWTILATFYATALRLTARRWCCMYAKERLVLHGTSRCPHLFWSGCGSTTAGASRLTGCSRLNSVGISRWTTIPSVHCAALQEAGPASNTWFTRTCSATVPGSGLCRVSWISG